MHVNTVYCTDTRLFGIWKERKIQFIAQMHRAIEIKYQMEDGWYHVWMFDHSSCHGTMTDNAS